MTDESEPSSFHLLGCRGKGKHGGATPRRDLAPSYVTGRSEPLTVCEAYFSIDGSEIDRIVRENGDGKKTFMKSNMGGIKSRF